jgi:hypothetical protein
MVYNRHGQTEASGLHAARPSNLFFAAITPQGVAFINIIVQIFLGKQNEKLFLLVISERHLLTANKFGKF